MPRLKGDILPLLVEVDFDVHSVLIPQNYERIEVGALEVNGDRRFFCDVDPERVSGHPGVEEAVAW